MPLVTIFRAFNPADAHVVRSRLEASEFHPVVMHELSALSLDGYAMAAGGILVQVPEEEVAAAQAQLASAQATYDKTAAGPSAADVANAEAVLRSAQANLQETLAGPTASGPGPLGSHPSAVLASRRQRQRQYIGGIDPRTRGAACTCDGAPLAPRRHRFRRSARR